MEFLGHRLPRGRNVDATRLGVLLIEGDPSLARRITQALAEAGGVACSVERVDRLEVGLTRVSRGGIDIVLLGVALANGPEISEIERIRALAPHVTVIVFAGVESAALVEEMVRQGAADVLLDRHAPDAMSARRLRDTIERVRVAKMLRLFQEALQQAADAMCILTAEPDLPGLQIVFANRAFTELTGYRPPEALSEALGGPDEAESGCASLLDQLRLASLQGRPTSGETVLDRKARGELHLEWALAPLAIDGLVTRHFLATLRDITDRKRSEEARRLLAEASRLMASSLDFEVTLEDLARLIVPVLADWCFIDIVEPDGSMRALAVAHSDPSQAEEVRLARSRGPLDGDDPAGVSAVMRSGRSAIYHAAPAWLTDLLARRVRQTGTNRVTDITSCLCVPLVARGRTLGAMVLVADESGRHFGLPDLELAEELAQHAAVAVDNARLYRAAVQTAERLELLMEVGWAAGQTLELDQALDRIVTYLGQQLDAELCMIHLPGPGGGLRVRTVYTRDPKLRARIESGAISSGQSMDRKQNDTTPPGGESDQRHLPINITALLPLDAWLHVAPIVGREGPLGTLVVCTSDERRPYRSEDAALVDNVAQHVAIAIENSWLYEEARHRSERLAALVEIARAVSATLDPESVYTIAIEQLQRLIPGERHSLLVYEPEHRGFRLAAVRSTIGANRLIPIGSIIPEDESVGAAACRAGGPVIFTDTNREPSVPAQRFAAQGFRSVMTVPIRRDDKWLGALSVQSRQTDAFDERQAPILEAFAAQIGVAMENASVHARLAASLEEVKAAQEQLVRIERLRAIGELAGGVAHDFNNLLAAISGRVDLLLRHPELPAGVRKDLEMIQQAALDGAETVHRLQELSRPREMTPFTTVDLIQICREALEVTRGRWRDDAQRRGIRIDIVDELAPVPPIAGRPSELREVLMNLIINAVDAMPGGGRLTLRTRGAAASTPGGGDEVCLEVSDNGTGMTEDVRKRVFEPFFTTKGNAGTGLGLSIVYGIVTRHNGRIRVESTPGAGTTFFLTFPVATETPQAQSPAPAIPSASRGRLLVIDDNPTILQNLTDLLRLAGHEVVGTSTGEAGLKAFTTASFDLVLTDLGMPGLTGFDVADAIAREAARRNVRVPVLLLTGWSEQVDRDQAARHGIAEVLRKPFRAIEIEAAVQRTLAQSMAAVAPASEADAAKALASVSEGYSVAASQVGQEIAGAAPPDLPRVLIVDDDEHVGNLLQLMLQESSIVVTTTRTLEQALEALGLSEYDIVLTDLHLEAQQGWEVARRIRSEWPQVIIGLLTGAAHTIDRGQVARNGIDLVLGKPFRHAQLLAAINEGMALRAKRLSDGSS